MDLQKFEPPHHSYYRFKCYSALVPARMAANGRRLKTIQSILRTRERTESRLGRTTSGLCRVRLSPLDWRPIAEPRRYRMVFLRMTSLSDRPSFPSISSQE